MAPVVPDGDELTAPHRPRSLVHLALYTTLLIPLACIPYIPIRRHLLTLKKSVNVLSNNTLALQHELNSTLLQARLLKEDKVRLVDQLCDFQEQLDAVKTQAADVERKRSISDATVAKHFHAIDEFTVRQANSQLNIEDIRRQLNLVDRTIQRGRLPIELLREMSTSFADVASFIEEVEIQLGWSHSVSRNHGIDRMRQLALKLNSIAKREPSSHPRESK